MQCCMWWLALLVLVLPWCVATLLVWIYSEAFATRFDSTNNNSKERDNQLDSAGSRIVSIVQTCSALVYILYIFFAIVWIGVLGRGKLCSYCCLVVGVPTFAVIPVAACGTLLVTAVSSTSKKKVDVDMGIAAAVSCLLSTVFCLVMTCWALMCGSRGRGKNHRYPIPLAYLPFLRDFKKDPVVERELNDVDKYTTGYPPPLSSFHDRESSDNSSANSPKSSDRRASTVSNKQEVPGRKISVSPSACSSKMADRKVSVVSSNGKSNADQKVSVVSSNGKPNADRKISVNSQLSQSRSTDRRVSVVSTTSSSKTTDHKSSTNSSVNQSRDRKFSADHKVSTASLSKTTDHRVSVVSTASSSKTTDRKSSANSSVNRSRERKFSVDILSNRKNSVGSSAGPMKANNRVGSLSSLSRNADRKL